MPTKLAPLPKLTACLSLELNQPQIRGVILVNENGRVFRRDAVTNELFAAQDYSTPLRVYPFETEPKAVDAFKAYLTDQNRDGFPKPFLIEGSTQHFEHEALQTP